VDNTVPVRVPTRGTPSRGYTLAGVVPEPAEVTIRGPESAIAEIASVRTTEVRLDGQEQSFTTAVTPLSPHEKVSIVDAEPIIVTAEITEEIATRPLGTLAVEIRAGSGLSAPIKDRFAVQPREVTVVAHGPLLKVEGLGASLTASVKVYGEDVTGRARDAVVEIDGVPEGVGIEVTPREVKVHLRK
jgi:YbbR domain-containing protein